MFWNYFQALLVLALFGLWVWGVYAAIIRPAREQDGAHVHDSKPWSRLGRHATYLRTRKHLHPY